METWQQVSGRTLDGVRIPQGIGFFVNEDKSKVKIRIIKPEKNMQDNDASLEGWGWALLLYLKLDCDIILSFEKPKFVWSLSPFGGEMPCPI